MLGVLAGGELSFVSFHPTAQPWGNWKRTFRGKPLDLRTLTTQQTEQPKVLQTILLAVFLTGLGRQPTGAPPLLAWFGLTFRVSCEVAPSCPRNCFPEGRDLYGPGRKVRALVVLLSLHWRK